MRDRNVFKILIPLLVLLIAPPSWGYGGGSGHAGGGGGHGGGGGWGGHGGGWGGYGRGWGGGYGIGLGWGPWWYPYGYDYGPYYDYSDPYDYAPPDDYGYAAQAPQTAPVAQTVRSDSSRYNLLAITDYHSELSAVLDQKLKAGDITKRQYDAETAHLDKIDQQAQKESQANGGYLTGDQEGVFVQQFRRAYYLIHHNFVVD